MGFVISGGESAVIWLSILAGMLAAGILGVMFVKLTVTTPAGIRTDVLDEFERVRKILDIDARPEKNIVLPCSKLKRDIPFRHVHIFNESELWKAGLPVVVTQAELVDVNENGEVGLYLGFQNLREKHIAALYINIICYNVLKEIKAEIKEVCFLDLDIKEGETYMPPKPVELPDRSIRRCEIVVRNVVFADEEIWTEETEGGIGPIGVQEKLEEPQNRLLKHKNRRPEKAAVLVFCAAGLCAAGLWVSVPILRLP